MSGLCELRLQTAAVFVRGLYSAILVDLSADAINDIVIRQLVRLLSCQMTFLIFNLVV